MLVGQDATYDCAAQERLEFLTWWSVVQEWVRTSGWWRDWSWSSTGIPVSRFKINCAVDTKDEGRNSSMITVLMRLNSQMLMIHDAKCFIVSSVRSRLVLFKTVYCGARKSAGYRSVRACVCAWGKTWWALNSKECKRRIPKWARRKFSRCMSCILAIVFY